MAKKNRFIQTDGTEKMHTSPRQEGTFLYFTSRGDDLINNIVGKGQSMIIKNDSTTPLNSQTIELGFLENIFLKNGYIFWQDATFGDTASLEIFLPANTPYPSDTKQGNAAENADGIITYITASQTPDATWVGTHILFPVDYTLFRFVNEILLVGTNNTGLVLESKDVAEIDKVLKFRLKFDSETSNPNLIISAAVEMYRTNTV